MSGWASRGRHDAGPLRRALLALHREILAAERIGLERVAGKTSGAAFLQSVVNDLRHAWLAPLTELIVQLDEALEEDRAADAPAPDDVAAAARALLAPPDLATAVGRRYSDLLQREPGVVMAHAAVVRALTPAGG